MEPGSFTSEPQYQRPDQRNSDIDYVRRPEPIVPAQPMGGAVPVPAGYAYDGSLAKRLLGKFGTDILTWNQLDYYGNAIPLGSFCYALAFITYGFYRCKVYRVNDTFLWAVILLFGGIGQCTAGFLEWCKGRSFVTALYLTYGFYCLSHYAYYIIPEWFFINDNQTMLYNYSENAICAFYSAMVVISFGILLASTRTNLLYILQCITAFVFFLLRKRNAAGILQVISGFFSLLICISQLINNEALHRPCFPTCPMSPYNEVDVMPNAMYPPVVAQPVVPVAAQPVGPVV